MSLQAYNVGVFAVNLQRWKDQHGAPEGASYRCSFTFEVKDRWRESDRSSLVQQAPPSWLRDVWGQLRLLQSREEIELSCLSIGPVTLQGSCRSAFSFPASS